MDWGFDGVDFDEERAILADAPGLRLDDVPQPRAAVGSDDVLVGRVRSDETVANGFALSSHVTTSARRR